MVNIQKTITILEKFAPLELAESWDNSGWQINLGKAEANNIMLCLTVTHDVIVQAVKHKCDLVISHHPLFFNEFKKISSDNVSQNILVEAIKNGIQIYSAHTNLDKTKGGVNDTLCERLGLNVSDIEEEYVRISKLNKAITLDDFVLKLKLSLNAQNVRIINPKNIQKIKSIAVCSGSGAEFANDINADVFVTGDIKYHAAIEITDKVLIDAGHFETERIILPKLKELLNKATPNAVIAKENSPFITA